MEEHEQYVTFKLNGGLYALSVHHLNEIVMPQKITSLPLAPRALLGVMPIRDGIVYVYSFRSVFRLPEVKQTSDTRVLISSTFGKQIGMLVDEVISVEEYAPDDILPTPYVGEASVSSLSGLIKDRTGAVISIVDLSKINL